MLDRASKALHLVPCSPLTHALVPPLTDACFPLTPPSYRFWVTLPCMWIPSGGNCSAVKRRRLRARCRIENHIPSDHSLLRRGEGVETFCGTYSLSVRCFRPEPLASMRCHPPYFHSLSSPLPHSSKDAYTRLLRNLHAFHYQWASTGCYPCLDGLPKWSGDGSPTFCNFTKSRRHPQDGPPTPVDALLL